MLKERIAVITGGSRGIGRAIALEMAAEHADIAILYAGREAEAEEVCRAARTIGVRAEKYQCNVASFEETKATVEQILHDFGGLDILVNNAGVTKDKLLGRMTEEDFSEVVDTNLKGAFHMIRHVYSHFAKKRTGRIINIASVAGLAGNPGQANYASSKAGLIGLTKTVAKELAGRNITCNAIAPGFIATDMTTILPETVKTQAVDAIPMKRMGTAEEVAQLAVFLASDKAAYITGEVIRIDGGLTM